MTAMGTITDRRYQPVPMDEIRRARERIKGAALRTPLVRMDLDDAPAEIFLKLENLQPIRSFKIRGAYNAIAKLAEENPDALAGGVWTASAGNMAQGVAWSARRFGIAAKVVVPETAPETKIAAVRRYGGEVIKVPVDVWFNIFVSRQHDGMTGLFVHPFSDPDVMAGNAVAGLEILEDLSDVDAVVVPYGGGGLCCGIASAIRQLKPACRIYAAEIETGAPVKPSLEAGEPVRVSYTPNYVDGIGGPFVNPEMFELTRQLIDDSLVVDTSATADAMRLLIERNRIVPEGAAAVATAAALAGMAGGGKVVCIVSGGNIDFGRLTTILQGGVP
jgi:threonine dehydratase